MRIRVSGRKRLTLLLPFLLAFTFQATQYARAPVEYNYYVVYAKNADIALRPGTDLSPNGATLLQNATSQEGLYNLTLERWGPGYMVNYTDAFQVCNREVFDIRMIAFNFTGASTGSDYLRIRLQNDTDDDGVGDAWVTVWDGSSTTLSTTNYVYLKAAASYGVDGGNAQVSVDLVIPSSGIGISGGTPELTYTGEVRLWFTSITF
jgi:hypothetical protein